MKLKFFFKNFDLKSKSKEKKKLLNILKNIKETNKPSFLQSFNHHYKYSFDKNLLRKYRKFQNINIFGMGGSSLGSKAIYTFLEAKIKKKVRFYENLNLKKEVNKKSLNVIISKSGNTLETVVNFNNKFNKNNKNVFISENKNNYLRKLADKLKSDVVDHKNFIGGRFSVMSEVGMLPAKLFGLNEKKFKKYNKLIINNKFISRLIENVSGVYQNLKNKKCNSVILNYDTNSEDLFKWYQQLVSESLGKNSKGIMPIISSMPKDNHSLLQLYLSGFNSNFYTFFITKEKKDKKLKSDLLFDNFSI